MNEYYLTYSDQIRFCPELGHTWQGHRKKCPICGHKTRPLQSSDGFKYEGPQRNHQYGQRIGRNITIDENLDEWDGHNKIIEPYNGYYMNRNHFKKELTSGLPKPYHYDGMSKAKAGKGYKDPKTGDERLMGVENGPCKEKDCDGTIISIQMNTSSYGFETCSEKVCNKCGMTYPGSFQVLEAKPPQGKSRHYETHEEWVKAMKPCPQRDFENHTDVAWGNEMYAHMTGKRPEGEESDEVAPILREGVFIGGAKERIYDDEKLYKALGLESKRQYGQHAENWGRSPEKRDLWRRQQHMDQVMINASWLGMTKGQVNEVKYIIDEHGVEAYGGHHRYEDVILCLCVYVQSKTVNNARMSVIKRQIPAWNKQYKKLYSLIVQKLNS